MTNDLTTAAREIHELQSALAAHIADAKAKEAQMRAEIGKRSAILSMSASGIDHNKIALAKTVISVRGTYAKGGTDRASVVSDAIKQLATGVPIRQHYGDLWRVSFGTKNYDRWSGQRCDCEYGYGPSHGSVIFEVGLKDAVRKREQRELSAEEIEAAIYYLANLERVQSAEAEARAAAAS